jgi:hypothetical protein
MITECYQRWREKLREKVGEKVLLRKGENYYSST